MGHRVRVAHMGHVVKVCDLLIRQPEAFVSGFMCSCWPTRRRVTLQLPLTNSKSRRSCMKWISRTVLMYSFILAAWLGQNVCSKNRKHSWTDIGAYSRKVQCTGHGSWVTWVIGRLFNGSLRVVVITMSHHQLRSLLYGQLIHGFRPISDERSYFYSG